MAGKLDILRREFHEQLLESVLSTDSQSGIPSNADKDNRLSVALAKGIVQEIGLHSKQMPKAPGQESGKKFEDIVGKYVEQSVRLLGHLFPFEFRVSFTGSIQQYEQYEHLKMIGEVLEANPRLRATLGDYLIKPDIVIGKSPFSEAKINENGILVDDSSISKLSPIRAINSEFDILHASISCKWTIRSDRSQNARTEGLNLIRNRKGRTPHIKIVTAEPVPTRLASIAMGTGDIDCVYHFALPELQKAALQFGNKESIALLEMLVDGKRLRDISDLPFDLLS